MLHWWCDAQVDRADLALRRPDGTMLWSRDRSIDQLPLAWASRENANGAEVYIRPARGVSWALVFLDDLAPERALRGADRYDALVISTSREGGCHLWLRTDGLLEETQRRACQRYLAERTKADLASTSGEHLGRLAGYRNHKRGGAWVNVIHASQGIALWTPPAELLAAPQLKPSIGTATRTSSMSDRSPSGQDWAWVRAACERGVPPDQIVEELVARCRARRGADAERYARRTIDRALRAD